jgi:hypothetical protein
VTYTLTDEDRAAIAHIDGYAWNTQTTWEAIALHFIERGRRLGLEEAAKAIDGYALQIGDKIYGTRTSKECAAAIRALKD